MIEKVNLETRDGRKVVGRRIIATTCLPGGMECVWHRIQDVETLREVARPFVRFMPEGDEPAIWQENRVFRFRLFLFGFIPLGVHTICVRKIDESAYEVETEEWDDLAVVWNHRVTMQALTGKVTRYTDSIDLYAGFSTRPVSWLALLFYRHRQRRWKKLLNRRQPGKSADGR